MCSRWPAATATRPGLDTLDRRLTICSMQKHQRMSRVSGRADVPGVSAAHISIIVCMAAFTIWEVHIRITLLRLMVPLTFKLISCTITVPKKKRIGPCQRLLQLSVSLGTSGPSINHLTWLFAVDKRALRESHGCESFRWGSPRNSEKCK